MSMGRSRAWHFLADVRSLAVPARCLGTELSRAGKGIGEPGNRVFMSRIGLIGCGAWGRHILRDLKQCGAIVHVVAPSETSRQNAVAHGADSIVARHADLPPVDGYVVAAPTSLHAAIIEELLPSGRPIYTEKPLTADVTSAE